MLFDFTLNFISLRDVSAYAAELTLLFGIMLLVAHFTFLSTTIKYSTLIEYSSKVSVYLLLLVQAFNLNTLCTYTVPTENIQKTFSNTFTLLSNFGLGFTETSAISNEFHFNGALILNYEIVILKIVLVFLAILVFLVSETFFKNTKLGYFEYNILLLSSLLGCLLTLSANDLMIFYISLEIQALAFYIMATMKKSASSSEAGLKYFVIGSFSSALLLFGISLIVLLTGHHNFNNVQCFLEFSLISNSLILSAALTFGVILIITALLIKLAVAPFHEWVADIYEGIPTPTALLFATIPKISNFFILVRLTQSVFGKFSEILQPFLILVCILSLILGSLNAFKQQNIKRFLAFSSVNHFGFILLGVIVGTKEGISASFFYLAFYIILTFGMWTSLILLTYVKTNQIYQLTRITELGGLVNFNPGIAFSIFLMLVSMGGIPPLAGFNAKISVFFVLIDKAFTANTFGLSFVVIVAVFSSVLSVFYYIRVIKILTFVSKVHARPGNWVPLVFKFEDSLPEGKNALNFGNTVGIYILAFITSFNLFSFLLFII